jgi:hypothetical protein
MKMKRFTLMILVMFVMLFSVMVGQVFGQLLDLPLGGQLKVMGVKELAVLDMFTIIPKDKKCIAIDIFIDNTNGKSEIKFGMWDSKLVVRDLNGYIYEHEVMNASSVDRHFDIFITLLRGDIYRSWYVIFIPIDVSVNDLSIRLENKSKDVYSKWLRIKI